MDVGVIGRGDGQDIEVSAVSRADRQGYWQDRERVEKEDDKEHHYVEEEIAVVFLFSCLLLAENFVEHDEYADYTVYRHDCSL